MPALIQESLPTASDDAVAAAQSALGLLFPPGYLDFLRAHNGGRPEPDGFEVQWQPGQPPATDWKTSSFGWFHAIGNPVRSGDLVRVNSITFRQRIPKDTLAIASDAGGNQLLLALAGPHSGQVLFWCKDHEAGDSASPGYDNVGVVASSLRDLLDHRLR